MTGDMLSDICFYQPFNRLNNNIVSAAKIIITTKRIQNKKHKKKRINKKWAKRYGYTEYEMQEKGKLIFKDGYVYMTHDDFELLKKSFETSSYCENRTYDL